MLKKTWPVFHCTLCCVGVMGLYMSYLEAGKIFKTRILSRW